jgi:gas vesicle protein
MGQSGSFWSGFVLGGLAGAAWALLNAPQPGEETRLQIQQRGVELKTRLEDLTADLQEQGVDAVREKLPVAGETRGPVTVAVEEGAEEQPAETSERTLSGEMNGPTTVTVEEETGEKD